MSEIKPVDWDNLPKVYAYQDDVLKSFEAVLMEKGVKPYPFLCLAIDDGGDHTLRYFKNISLTDPRPKKRMRTMTAEELNDIYHEFGKDFRYRINSLAPIFGFYNYSLDTKICSDEEYSTNRGKVWQKCEVAE